jgi:hypothetical protein
MPERSLITSVAPSTGQAIGPVLFGMIFLFLSLNWGAPQMGALSGDF